MQARPNPTFLSLVRLTPRPFSPEGIGDEVPHVASLNAFNRRPMEPDAEVFPDVCTTVIQVLQGALQG